MGFVVGVFEGRMFVQHHSPWMLHNRTAIGVEMCGFAPDAAGDPCIRNNATQLEGRKMRCNQLPISWRNCRIVEQTLGDVEVCEWCWHGADCRWNWTIRRDASTLPAQLFRDNMLHEDGCFFNGLIIICKGNDIKLWVKAPEACDVI